MKSTSIRIDEDAMSRLISEKKRLNDLFIRKNITYSDVIRFHVPKQTKTTID